jgi:hypothetical protein
MAPEIHHQHDPCANANTFYRDCLKANGRAQAGLRRVDIKFRSGSAREGTVTTKTSVGGRRLPSRRPNALADAPDVIASFDRSAVNARARPAANLSAPAGGPLTLATRGNSAFWSRRNCHIVCKARFPHLVAATFLG